MEIRNPYKVLGVSEQSSTGEIKSAYRKLAREFHPDVNQGDSTAEEKFKQVSAAFEVLSDPERKALYDEFGDDGLHPGFDPHRARAYQRHWRARDQHGVGGVSLGDLFGGGQDFDLGEVFGGFGGSGLGRDVRQGQNIKSAITVSFEHAILGGEQMMSFTRPDGKHSNLKVKVPSGIETGKTIRLVGQGMPGRGSGVAGDLLLEVTVAKHPWLEREGNDLHLKLPVTVGEAMLGAEVEVPTVDGSIKLKVPAGSQNGTRMRVRGKGVAAKRGDLFVTLDVRLPLSTSDEVKDLARDLDDAYDEDVRQKFKKS